jgi:hypothetical protein
MGSFPSEFDSAWRKRKKELGRELSSQEGEQVEGELFESWIASRRYDELIRRIHHEYGVEGGLHECAVLGYALREAGDVERIRTLFSGLISRRTKAFWDSWPSAETGHVAQMLLASQRMASTMETYLEYFHSLTALDMQSESEQVRSDMIALQTRIKPKTARK